MSFASLHPVFSTIPWYLTLAAPYAAVGALLFSVIALCMLVSLRRRLTRLALGRNGSIEETISILTRDTKELQQFRVELEKYLKLAEVRLRGSIQGVGMVRFNPFAGKSAGGNQSFSVAFLDELHSGVVLSTHYARDHVGVYAKPLDKGMSTFELTDEERGAIQKAKHHIAEHRTRTNA
ncbi:MAG: DUF4446 family protein [Candidatus Adlerbacteria bacterium]